jgi:hypothetical protein
MIIIYRACPNKNPVKNLIVEPKEELIRVCFKSFKEAFKGVDYKLIVLVDKPNQKTAEIFKNCEVEETSYNDWNEGNIKSFHRQLDLAASYQGEKFLLVEDDYLWVPGAGEIIDAIDFPFFTPYDHPHHYPLREEVFLSSGRHWRTNISTTLTFGGKVECLKKVAPTMKLYGWNDHKMWMDILENDKDIQLWSPIPSLATHAEPEVLAPFLDWQSII